MAVFLVLFAVPLPSLQENPRDIREWVEKLGSDRVEERDLAARKLRGFGKAALPELEKAAGSTDRERSERARFLLKLIPIHERLTRNLLERVPGIDDRLAFGNGHTWTMLFLEIAPLVTVEEFPDDPRDGAPKAKDVNTRIVRLWKDNPDRGKALPLRVEDVRMFVLPALRGAQRPEERMQVLQAISERNLRSAVPDLISLLKDPDAELRSISLEALHALRAGSAVREVTNALKDPSDRVRLSAVQALALVGSDEVIRDLLPILEDHSPLVRDAAIYSLNVRHAQEAAPAIAKLLTDPDAGVRSSAAVGLGFLGSKEAGPALILALQDPEAKVRAYALDSLGKLKIAEAAPSLPRLLHDPATSVRRSCVIALSAIKSKEAVPDLEKALNDPEHDVELAAVEELRSLGARESIPAIRKLLSSSEEEVRERAAYALCQWGDREGIPILLLSRHPLGVLNQFRCSDVWNRLVEKVYTGAVQGSRRAVVGRIADIAGMTVEWPRDPARNEVPWALEPSGLSRAGESLLASLFLTLDDPAFEIVLEEHAIRILPREKAVALWKAWWEEAGKKK